MLLVFIGNTYILLRVSMGDKKVSGWKKSWSEVLWNPFKQTCHVAYQCNVFAKYERVILSEMHLFENSCSVGYVLQKSENPQHKKWNFPLKIYPANVTKSDLVTFSGEILNGKLQFFCNFKATLKVLQRCIKNLDKHRGWGFSRKWSTIKSP